MYFESEFHADYEYSGLRGAMVSSGYRHRDKVAIGRSGRTCGSKAIQVTFKGYQK
jgi:hypothetical protein